MKTLILLLFPSFIFCQSIVFGYEINPNLSIGHTSFKSKGLEVNSRIGINLRNSNLFVTTSVGQYSKNTAQGVFTYISENNVRVGVYNDFLLKTVKFRQRIRSSIFTDGNSVDIGLTIFLSLKNKNN